MERVSVPKPETREVCTACGQVDGYHLQKCRISELQAEVERLRNCYATEVRTAQAYLRRTEQSERKLAEAVAALRKYGKHSQLCSVVGGYVGPCTCGFDEVTK